MIPRSVKMWHSVAAVACLILGAAWCGCGNGQPLRPAAGGDARPVLDPRTCNRPPNGCGPGGILGVVVPECPVPPVCFSDVCSEHDLCYRLCGIDRSVCDDALRADLTGVCTETFADGDPLRVRCTNIAFIYATVVEGLGEGVFAVTQVLGCLCGDEIPAARAIQRHGAINTPSRVPPYCDRDDDLLPDDWETAVGLDPLDPADALADYDGDDRNNLMEYVFDTDPFDPSSARPDE